MAGLARESSVDREDFAGISNGRRSESGAPTVDGNEEERITICAIEMDGRDVPIGSLALYSSSAVEESSTRSFI